jgi:hypothetical protein
MSSVNISAAKSTLGRDLSAWRAYPLMLTIALFAAASATAAPAAGDTFVYRLLNGYNNETRGQISYRIDKIDAGRITVSVIPESPGLGAARTEIYTSDGNWLRHTVVNHDQPTEYEFASAYPAYQFPLETGKSWSLRVDATNSASGQRASVRVDGEVLGSERIRVPAGEFDTIKVRRMVYAGDSDGIRKETNIQEIDWYAPALGRAVRTASTSIYRDQSRSRCCQFIRGDWDIYELVALPPPAH